MAILLSGFDPESGRSITPHGLQATFRTWGENAGFPRDLLEESLGHQIGTAVERAYRRTDSLDPRREIMEAWADFCSSKNVGRRDVQSASKVKRPAQL
jgi:integrase